MKNINTYNFKLSDYNKIKPLVKDDETSINIISTAILFFLTIALAKLLLPFSPDNLPFCPIFTIIIAICIIIFRMIVRYQPYKYLDTLFDFIILQIALINYSYLGNQSPPVMLFLFLLIFQIARIQKLLYSCISQVVITLIIIHMIYVYPFQDLQVKYTLTLVIYAIIGLIVSFYYSKHRISLYLDRYDIKITSKKELALSNSIRKKLNLFAKETETILLEYDLNANRFLNIEVLAEKYPFLVAANSTIENQLKNITSIDKENKAKILNAFKKAKQGIEVTIDFQANLTQIFYFNLSTFFIEEFDDICLIILKDVSSEYRAKSEYQDLVNYHNYQLKGNIANLVFNITTDQLVSVNSENDILVPLQGCTSDFFIRYLINAVPINEDRINYFKTFDRNTLIQNFNEGKMNSSLQITINVRNDYRLIKIDNRLITHPITNDIICIASVIDITETYQTKILLDGIIKYDYEFTALINTFTKTATTFKSTNNIKKNSLDEFINSIKENANSDISPVITDIKQIKEIFKVNKYAQFVYETKDNFNKSIVFYEINNENIGVFQSDITSYNEYQMRNLEQLQNALESAKTANIAKTVFLSRMSHDIRTPLNAILGLTNLAIDDINNHLSYNALNTHLMIRENSNHLLDLINDILEMSSIESEKINLNEENFNLRDNLNQLVERLKPLTFNKNTKINLNIDIKNEFVIADKLKINRIIENLVNNAVKYSLENKSIDINCKQLSTYNDIVNYEFEIKDYGVGMDSEKIGNIFEPFVTGESENAKGTGLGLSIVKQLTDVLGGNIKVDSSVNEGSTFVINLSLIKAKKDHVEHHNSKQILFNGLKILVVEDNDVNAMIVTKMLNKKGISVIRAVNGLEGVEKYNKYQEDINLVLMDIAMPIMDGFTSTEKIRKINKEIPIIALSANAFVEDHKKSLKAGMNAHILKPIDQEQLFNTIATYTSNSRIL